MKFTICCLFISFIFSVGNSSCKKSSDFQKVDTVKYEALLNNAIGWYTAFTIPPYTSISGITILHDNNHPGFTYNESGMCQNIEIIFTVNKYSNKPISLSAKGFDQIYGMYGNVDSVVTMN